MDQTRSPVEAARLLDLLAVHAPDSIWMFTPDWSELLFASAAYEDIWGRSVDSLEADPTSFLEGVHPADRERVVEEMEVLSSGEPVDVEFRANASEDYTRHVWAQGQPIREDGELAAVAGFVRDVTEQRRTERELARTNERLENLSSVVSHDLRNPLTVAKGRLALLAEECESAHLEPIDRSLDRMETIVDDLLDLAERDTSVGALEPVALAALARECWETVETEDASIRVESSCRVLADESRLKQVFENLFRNAVEHGGRDVTVRVGDQDRGFYVLDDGSGFQECDPERVFEMGYSTTSDGTGLGLGIVQEVAHGHGWTVAATGSADGGARFEFGDVETDPESGRTDGGA